MDIEAIDQRFIWEVSAVNGDWSVLVVTDDPKAAMEAAVLKHPWETTTGVKMRGVEALFLPTPPQDREETKP